MSVQVGEVDGVKKVALSGRLDSAGASAVEIPFSAAILPAGRSTAVDLSQVTFLASLGIRMLLTTARSLASKGGRLVIYGATPAVAEVLETSGIGEIVPVAMSEAEALAAIATFI